MNALTDTDLMPFGKHKGAKMEKVPASYLLWNERPRKGVPRHHRGETEMKKRPLNPRFSQAVLDGWKFTTIRDTQWPAGVPIMLYNWSGAAYRSKQIDVAAIIVQGFWPIDIAHSADGTMRYACGMENAKPLHETEGFTSRDEMDEWFRKIVKPGQAVRKTLMRFRLLCNVKVSESL